MDCEIDDDESTSDAHDNHACELLSPVTVCAISSHVVLEDLY